MGYGSAEIQSECPGAIILFMVQCAVGVVIECLATGVVFAKLIRPKRRRQTVLFSRFAVVRRLPETVEQEVDGGDEDGGGDRLVLQFRVADMRRSTLIDARVSAVVVVVRRRRSADAGLPPLWQKSLELQSETGGGGCSGDDGGGNRATFLLGSETMTHVIDSSSPLFRLLSTTRSTVVDGDLTRPAATGSAEKDHCGSVGSADGFGSGGGDNAFEIVVSLEATDDSTGMTTQLRTSYVPSEILLDHRLAPLPVRHLANGLCAVDYTDFHLVLP